MNIYNKIAEYSNKGMPFVICTVVDKKGDGPVEIGKKMVVTPDNHAFGTVGGGALEYNARELCKELLITRQSMTKTYLLNEGKILNDAETLPMTCGGVITLFFEYIGPKAFVYIFGAGHVGQALTNILKTVNFHVTVIDERTDVIEKFVGGDVLVNIPFSEYLDTHTLEKNSFIVVCTPSHKYDYSVINKVIEKKLKLQYFGMLCSKEKLKDYIKKTYETYGEDVDLTNFYSPIGLDLGGGSPEEIAISITSEILAVSNKKENHVHMRNTINSKNIIILKNN